MAVALPAPPELTAEAVNIDALNVEDDKIIGLDIRRPPLGAKRHPRRYGHLALLAGAYASQTPVEALYAFRLLPLVACAQLEHVRLALVPGGGKHLPGLLGVPGVVYLQEVPPPRLHATRGGPVVGDYVHIVEMLLLVPGLVAPRPLACLFPRDVINVASGEHDRDRDSYPVEPQRHPRAGPPPATPSGEDLLWGG
eukprot:CAMPEP_0175527804 /NCGR_PEP_ID=MMETSP0096-20121207/20314_1 /TAXON_ID=311494 /ORGANISM="Alexandrium monilatum, Strain CCMP3105" /LENGTH=195 /DNA_ID=CAMNT_0016830465 /DNA_START=80 /DNA_END=665 /DNA_ORIENTATION=+